MEPGLAKTSWKSLITMYKAFGEVLEGYNSINARCHIPKPNIEYSDEENLFYMRFWSEVSRLNKQIQALDFEISRRNTMIGVMG